MAESEKFRLFVALTVPEGVKAKLAETQAELRSVLPGLKVRWARREQFHLTLRFLGDVEAARVEALGAALRTACRGFGALHLRAAQVGFFPNPRYPRVLWAGVQDQADQLTRLYAAVADATDPFTAEAREDRFTSHLTLARVKTVNRPEAEALERAATGLAGRVFGQWTAHQIELMRSQLLPQGARHNTIVTFALAERPAELA